MPNCAPDWEIPLAAPCSAIIPGTPWWIVFSSSPVLIRALTHRGVSHCRRKQVRHADRYGASRTHPEKAAQPVANLQPFLAANLQAPLAHHGSVARFAGRSRAETARTVAAQNYF